MTRSLWVKVQMLSGLMLLYCAVTFAQGKGNIMTVAGTGTGGYSGDGGLSISANIFLPFGVAVDAAGNFYIADTGNNRIRKVSISNYVIKTVAGSGANGFCGDGGPATSACLNQPTSVAVDSNGNLYIADNANSRIRRVDAKSHTITTYAGNGTPGFCGDGGPATQACLHSPSGVATDSKGNVYVAEEVSCRVRKILASNHTITTVAGDGTIGFSGDGGPAIFAELSGPLGVAVDSSNNIYIADSDNHRIRKVTAGGTISTLAGNGLAQYCGDGGAAKGACLRWPYAVAVDGSGNVFIADSGNDRVRKVDATSKKINTIAGGGTASLGDGGPAVKAFVNAPRGVAVFSTKAGTTAAHLYIADTSDERIREVQLK